jgi:hypothetical protein
MGSFWRRALIVALSAVFGLGLTASSRADTIITSPNTAFQVGVAPGSFG